MSYADVRKCRMSGKRIKVTKPAGPPYILSLRISMLGTESGTQFVAKRYKTLHNVERAAAEGRILIGRKC